MKINSKKPKRITCSKMYRLKKIQKERLRRKSKRDKMNPTKPGNPLKNLTVPNCAPFKERILAEAMEMKTRVTEEKKLQRIKLRAEKSAEKFVAKDVAGDREKDINDSHKDSSRKFISEVNKVIEMSDVVIEVLDARDPIGTRCKDVEDMALSKGKKLILLLNKSDLIPTDNLRKWIEYLRRYFPVLPFKSSTQLQKNKLSQNRRVDMKQIYDQVVLEGKNCLGAQHLLKMLGNYSRNGDIKTSIKVGLVGYPNVGKSSIINSLKRSKSCTTGALPGLTRQAREVMLDKHISLIDSPGVVLDDHDGLSTSLRNACRIEKLSDPIRSAKEILARAGRDQLSLQYDVHTSDLNNLEAFLALLAEKRGFIDRGGIVNLEKAAILLLNDWNSGKIKYYTMPPEDAIKGIESTIVSNFADEFDLKSIGDELHHYSKVSPSEGVCFAPSDIQMEDTSRESSGKTCVASRLAEKSKKLKVEESVTVDAVDDTSYRNLRKNKERRVQFKKVKKTRKRAEKLSVTLSENLHSAFENF